MSLLCEALGVWDLFVVKLSELHFLYESYYTNTMYNNQRNNNDPIGKG